MFQKITALYESLLPPSEFTQKKVCVVTRFVDVVKDGGTANLAGIVDDDIAEPHHSLRDAGLNGYVLDLAQRNVSGCAGY